MNTTQISLTAPDIALLHDLARQTGKAEDEVVHDALELLREQVARRQERLAKLQQACGMWKERDDLPDLREMREGWSERTKAFDDSSL
jgi:Arc/MetJ-type ribon-helix-helix transcriptional regulator